jgi:hypothetical protein
MRNLIDQEQEKTDDLFDEWFEEFVLDTLRQRTLQSPVTL